MPSGGGHIIKAADLPSRLAIPPAGRKRRRQIHRRVL